MNIRKDDNRVRAMLKRTKHNLITYESFVMVKWNEPPDENKENLGLQSVVDRTRTSLHQIKEITGVARSTVNSISKRHKYHLYRERPCQGRQYGNTLKRTAFCHWFIQKNKEISNFLKNPLVEWVSIY